MSFYYRKKTKVAFEPRSDLLAASFKGKSPEEGAQRLLAAVADPSLHPIEVSSSLAGTNVRVFQLPEGMSEQDKIQLEESLSEQPMVRYVGPVVSFDDQGVSFMTNEFVIKYKQQFSREAVNEMVRPYNLEVIRQLPYADNAFVLRANVPASYGLLDAVNELAQNKQVEYAEPNLVSTPMLDFVPNDFLFASQPNHPLINTEEAWDITRGDRDIIIAVVDAGCDIDHPDLTNAPALGWNKVYEPFDFTGMDSDPTLMNSSYGRHGTKSSGIATANANNSEGVAGVAPGCRLMPIRWPSGSPVTEWADMYLWIAGFDPENPDPDFPDPISPGADVISNSIGRLDFPISSVMSDAFDYITEHGRDGKGCLIVFAAGNDNQDMAVDSFSQWAAYDKTIAVASSTISPPDTSEGKVSTSNFGPAIDVCAPGGGPSGSGEARTLSSTNVGEGDTAGSASASSNDYDDFGQTSCACPQVAGAAALMLSVYPGMRWSQVRQVLRDTADQIDAANTDPIGQWVDRDGDGVADFSQWYGYGRINVGNAVAMAKRLKFFDLITAVLSLIKYATFAFVIVVGGLIITPEGIQCTVCGPIINNLLGMVAISLGGLGLATSALERYWVRSITAGLSSRKGTRLIE